MEELGLIGDIIKQKRLSLNLRMDDVAKQAGITRATLWSIEKGEGKCSLSSFMNVLSVLKMSIDIKNVTDESDNRTRATRLNSSKDKKINRFIVMCVEQYALYIEKSSKETYEIMRKCGIIDDLTNDYEDLHGMSTVYLNEYFDALVRRETV